jgi:hypothetical protein
MREPVLDHWLADPLVLDAAFQAMILWTRERLGAGSLPSYLGRYRQFRARFPAEGVRLVVRVTKSLDNLAAADVEIADFSGGLVARIEGYECTVDKSLNEAFSRNSLGAAEVS